MTCLPLVQTKLSFHVVIGPQKKYLKPVDSAIPHGRPPPIEMEGRSGWVALTGNMVWAAYPLGLSTECAGEEGPVTLFTVFTSAEKPMMNSFIKLGLKVCVRWITADLAGLVQLVLTVS